MGLGAALLLPFFPACATAAPLVVAAHPWPPYNLLRISCHEAIQPEAQIRFLETATSAESVLSLKAGKADAAMLTLDELLLARSKGLDLVAVLLIDLSFGADLIMARHGIESLAGLAGKRVAVDRSSVGLYFLQLALQQAGMTMNAFSVIDLPVDQQLTAWQAKRFDAVVTFEPMATRLERAGMQRLFDSRQTPGAIMDLLVVKRNRLRTTGAVVRQMISCYLKAVERSIESAHDIAYRLSAGMQLPHDELPKQLRQVKLANRRLNQRYLGGESPEINKHSIATSHFLVQTGSLTAAEEPDRVYSGAYLPPAEQLP